MKLNILEKKKTRKKIVTTICKIRIKRMPAKANLDQSHSITNTFF